MNIPIRYVFCGGSVVTALLCGLCSMTMAQNSVSAESSVPESVALENDQPLNVDQEAVSIRFRNFEKTLLQMAEYMRKTDPDRADLLIRAIGRSKEDRLAEQMDRIVVLLSSEQLGDAVERQEQLIEQLGSLLGLLQSEDRLSDLEKEMQRLKELVKQINRLIGREKDLRIGTERGERSDRLTDRQAKLADETGELLEQIDSQDAEREASNNSQNGESGQNQQSGAEAESSETSPDENGEQEPEENGSEGAEPSDGSREQEPNGETEESESQQSESSADGQGSQSSENSESSESQSSESQESQSQQSQSQSSQSQQSESESQESSSDPSSPQDNQQQTPGREELEQSKREMERAIKELEKEARDEASEHQDAAIAKLRAAKEKLEEILRQLREEERKLMLASLEARFQKMLTMQLLVYDETLRLDKVPEQERESLHASRAIKLSRDENEIAIEAAKALSLLREEGSSVAFPQAVEQMQEDMRSVTQYLERGRVDVLTQDIEKDIIEALNEMIEAMQMEMEKQNDQQQQQQQQQQGEPQDDPLVAQLAELKMLRSLQLRVNRRTKRLGQLFEGEQALDENVVEQLRQLADRQSRIQQATYDLVTGRNQ